MRTLIEDLKGVPAQTDPLFPFEVRRIVAGHVDRHEVGAWEELLGLDEKRLRELGSDDPQETRFLALYALLLTHWRKLNFQLYRELVEKHELEFPEERYPYVLTFRAQALASRGDDRENLAASLDLAREAMAKLPDCPAVLHLYVSTAIKAEGVGIEPGDEEVAAITSAIRQAIAIDARLTRAGRKGKRFAQYHATYARWLALRGKYREARRELHTALDLGDSTNVGRLAEFLEIRGHIARDEALGPLRGEVEQLRQQVEEESKSLREIGAAVGDQVRVQAIQLLGVLAAVLAFLFTGTEIARQLEFDQAAKLMLVVSGTILIVFGGFALVFNADRISTRRIGVTATVGALGVALMIAGFAV